MTGPDRAPSRPNPAKPSRPAAGGTPDAPAAGGASFWRFLTGWVLVPLVVAASIFAGGVHCGARNPDAWYTSAARWVQDRIVP